MTLTQILQKIKEAFYTKKEIDAMGGGSSLSDAISQKANASDLTAHTSNTNIHVTTSDKTKWNAKQDALTSQQISNIDNVANKANDSDVVHKTGDYLTGSLKYDTNSTNDTYLGGIEYLKDNTRFGYLLGHVYDNGQTKDLLIRGEDHVYISSNYVTLSSGSNTLTYNNGILYNLNGALGTSANKWSSINGFEVTGIGHIGSSSMDQSGNVKTYTRTNPNVGTYAHYCVAPDNGWVACREHGGSGTFQVCALGSDLNSDPIIISPPLNQYQFGSIPVRKGEYYAIISYNASASHTMRFIYNNG